MKLLVLTLIFFSHSLAARETDNFLALSCNLTDSSEKLHFYLQKNMEKRIAEINGDIIWYQNQLPVVGQFLANRYQKKLDYYNKCENIAIELFNTFRRPTYQYIEQWADRELSIEQCPNLNVSNQEYIRQSIYNELIFPSYNFPLSRVINYKDIYIGSDKLGHFISFGVKYFEKYLTELNLGKSAKLAIAQAIIYGYQSELTLLGKHITGVISYADLEANYNGMMQLIQMCQPQSSFKITKNQSQWELEGNINLDSFINPRWDESFFPSLFDPRRFTSTKTQIIKYCDQWKNGILRHKNYKDLLENKKYNNDFYKLIPYLESNFSYYPKQIEFSLETICKSHSIDQ